MSYVALGKNMCIVCHEIYKSGEILLNRRLKDIPEEKTITSMGMCFKCENRRNEGYIALIEVIPGSEGPMRTGKIAHIREKLFTNFFSVEMPPQKVAYIDAEGMKKLERLSESVPSTH